MSTAGAALTATKLAQDLGISLQIEDIPTVVAAIHRAYGTGLRDGLDAIAMACLVVFPVLCVLAARLLP